MGFSEYPSAFDAVLWMNADFYTRILSQLGNGIIMKNGDDSVTISSTGLIKTQAKMFDMQSCLLLEKASYLVLLMRYIISKSNNLFDKVHICTLANLWLHSAHLILLGTFEVPLHWFPKIHDIILMILKHSLRQKALVVCWRPCHYSGCCHKITIYMPE